MARTDSLVLRNLVSSFVPLEYHEKINIFKDYSAIMRPCGHTPGAA